MYFPLEKEFTKKAKKYNLIPVYTEVFADMETPVSAFLKIDNKKHSYLLESVEGGENIGRYSFLGSDPNLVFKSKGRKIEIIEKGKKRKYETKKDPLYELELLMKEYKVAEVSGLPKFFGGLVGYMGYDMVRFFETIPDSKKDDLKLPDSCFILTDTILIFDHVNHMIKIVSNAKVDKNAKQAYKLAIKKIDSIVKQLKKPLRTSLGEPYLKKDIKTKIKSNEKKSDFEAKVKKAKEYIKAGDIFQVVLSQRLESKVKTDSFNLYRALRSVNPSPYMFFLRENALQIIGSSPEILVQCEDRKVTVRPIAGTRKRGETLERDSALADELLNDKKERAEHIMLVDLGRNDIGRVCKKGSVKPTELMTIEKYSHVMHIVSDVKGDLAEDKNVFDVIRATFPAGTVSGAPKVRAMEIIEELEKSKRNLYAGAVGYFSFSGNLDFCITIRTIVFKNSTAYIQAGAGIVADSVPELEYKECLNKAKAMIKAVELAKTFK
ncbi:anthranilate synthase component I [Candidatus Auribacterota bacterium]